MKTNPNEPIKPCVVNRYGDGSITPLEGSSIGLTKREHMAIEFTKAYLSAYPDSSSENIAKIGLEQADALIKLINEWQ